MHFLYICAVILYTMSLSEQISERASAAQRFQVCAVAVGLFACVEVQVAQSTLHEVDRPQLSASATWQAIQTGKTIYDGQGFVIEACDQVPQQSITEANALLNEGTSDFTSSPDSIPGELAPAKDLSVAKASEYFADKYGIHYPTPIFDQLDALLAGPGKWERPYTDYLGFTQDLMQREFDISVKIGQEGDIGIESTDNILTDADLEDASMKESILNLALMYSRQTHEMVGLEGVRQIVFTKNRPYPGQAFTSDQSQAVVISLAPGQVISQAVYKHEAMHFLDAKLCGSPQQAADDPEYAALNITPDAYSKDSDVSTFESAGLGALELNAFQALYRGERLAYCDLTERRHALGQGVETASNYDPNIVEDKGELGKALMNPLDGTKFLQPESGTPVLDAKLRLLFARLYAKAPNLGKYWASMHLYDRFVLQSEARAAPSCTTPIDETWPPSGN